MRSSVKTSVRKHSKKRNCPSGYVRNKSTARCVFKSGNVGRKLNKKRAAKKKSHKRAGRPSPSASATLFPKGYEKIGNDGKLWKMVITSNGFHRWVRA